MKTVLIFIPIMLLSLFFESTIISFPLFFLSAAVLFLLKRDLNASFVIFLFALLFDSLTLSHIGFTPLFLFLLFFVISLLETAFAVEGLWLSIILSIIGLEIYRYSISYPFSPLLFTVLVVSGVGFMYMAHKKELEKKSI